MNPDGSKLRNLTKNQNEDYFHSWSPDGNKILFVSTRDGNGEIYVMNADGSNQRNLGYSGNLVVRIADKT